MQVSSKNLKSYRKPLVVLVLTMLVLVFSWPTVFAGEERSGDIVHILSDEVVNDDLYVGAENVVIDGVVKGDVLGGAQTMTINGRVEGNLIVGAQFITINGEVEQDVIAGAQMVTVNGIIGDDLRGGAQIFTINGTVGDDFMAGAFSHQTTAASKIGGEVYLGGYQAQLDGEIGEDVNGGFNGLEILGTVGGNVNVELDSTDNGFSPIDFMSEMPEMPALPRVAPGLTLGNNAQIDGTLTYRSPEEFSINDDKIGGEVAYILREANQDVEFNNDKSTSWSWVWGETQRLLRLLLFGAIAIWLFPALITKASQQMGDKLLPSFGWGLLLTFILFPLSLIVIILMGLLIGFPFLIFTAYLTSYLLILFYFGALVTAKLFGHAILQRAMPARAEDDVWVMMVGLVGIWLITIVPILGSIISALIGLAGTGSLLLTFKNRSKEDTMSGMPVSAPA